MAPTGALPSSISIKMNNTKHSLRKARINLQRSKLVFILVPPYFLFELLSNIQVKKLELKILGYYENLYL